MSEAPEISVVIPCLNEEETIGECIKKALGGFEKAGILGEVVVVDNGSTDRSKEIAESLGARVVREEKKGYGNALRRGFEEAMGRYILMGDADNTYDFTEVGSFVAPLRNGTDLVMGSRLKGNILPGAMPWANRWIGNPILSGMLRFLFKTSVSDSHCGMRAFSKDAYKKMELKSPGMELASEIVIKASRKGMRISEIPITYYPRKGESKLNPVRDAWRHTRFMLLLSPSYLFLFPGMVLFGLGLFLLFLIPFGSTVLYGHELGPHFMVLASLLTLIGFQTLNTGVFAKTYAKTEGIEDSQWINRFHGLFTLERGIAIGAAFFLAGLSINLYILIKWIAEGFGALEEIKTAIFSLTLMVIGVQTVFSSFFLALLNIKK